MAASAEEVAIVEAGMRAADVAELKACGHGKDAIWQAYRASSHVDCLHLGGEPAMIYGVVPVSILSGEGIIWALGTDAVTRNARQFLRESPDCLRECFKTYDHLYNYVDTRNRASRRWLKWLGFEMGEPEPFGPYGMPFHRFDMRV